MTLRRQSYHILVRVSLETQAMPSRIRAQFNRLHGFVAVATIVSKLRRGGLELDYSPPCPVSSDAQTHSSAVSTSVWLQSQQTAT